MKLYVEQAHWDVGYENMDLDIVNILPEQDIIKCWLLDYIPSVENSSCFEIGCFPGRYLNVFGERGYKVSGIDLTPRVLQDLPAWFKKRGINTGVFQFKDVADLDYSQKYNVVFSMGFIEHFSNWKELVHTHARISNDYVVIVTPNFRGFIQRSIHLLFDLKNHKRHNIKSMNPGLWAQILEKEGFDILYKGSIGNFEFWVEDQPRSEFQKRLLRIIRNQLGKYLVKLSPNRFISPYFGVVAKKANG